MQFMQSIKGRTFDDIADSTKARHHLTYLKRQRQKQAKSRKYRGIFEEHSPEKYDKFGKRIGLNRKNICKSQRDETRCPGE